MSIKYKGVRIIDSYNFVPVPLSQMPAAFGLEELKKGYFPHQFNKQENWSYFGRYPDAKYYDPDHMKQEGNEKFYEWYNKQTGKTFHFQQELLSYCYSNVDILH